MTEAEQHEFAGKILDQTLRRLVEEGGFDRLDAVRTLVAFGLDMLPAMICAHHLADEYQELAAALAERIEDIPSLEPGKDVAKCMH